MDHTIILYSLSAGCAINESLTHGTGFRISGSATVTQSYVYNLTISCTWTRLPCKKFMMSSGRVAIHCLLSQELSFSANNTKITKVADNLSMVHVTNQKVSNHFAKLRKCNKPIEYQLKIFKNTVEFTKMNMKVHRNLQTHHWKFTQKIIETNRN